MIPCILKKTNVIVVNDDKTQIRVLSGLLQKEGINVQAFYSAADALTVMNQNPPPDLIITDLYMPDIDGWRFCRLLRSPEYQKFNQTPILIISATFSGNDIADISADLGANGFLPAPVDGKQFLGQVQTLLNGQMPRMYLHVLIVEDSLTLSGFLSKAFQSHGYVVKTAQSCTDAFNLFKKTAFDVAIIDYHLPDGQGDGLLHTFRSQRSECDCIMMTTDPDPGLALSWMKQGAAAYLHKPFKPEYLIELCVKARRERSLLRVEALLDVRTRELRQSEERFHSIVRNAFDMIALLDTNGRYLYCNSAYTHILGYSPEELAGRSCFEIVHPEDREPAQQFFQKNTTANIPSAKTQLRLLHREGRCLHVDHQARFITDSSNTPLILLNARDVTGQKQAENLLKQKSNERRLLLDTIPTQIWYLTDIETYGAVNRAHADFLERSPKAIAYKKLDQIFSADVASVCRGSNTRVFKTGLPAITEEWFTNSSGERHLIHITKTPKLDDQGRVEFVVCAGNDITELRSLERQFRGIFEKAPIGIEIYDADGKLQAANPKCIDLLGIVDEKEIAGLCLFDDPNVTDDVKSKLQHGETVYYEVPFDFEKVRSAGLYRTTRSGIIHLAILITLLKPNDSLDLSGYLVIIQDITQKKQYETECLLYEHRLQQLQKAESLSRMAGAVAHNFNNMLQAVIGNLEIAMEELPQGSKHLTEALIAAQKAAGVSSMMLAYRGQLPGKLALLDLSDVCRQSLPLLQASAPTGVVIETDIPASGPMIRASAGQIHQTLTNLLANACEAAGKNPNTVTITVKTVSKDQIPATRRFPVDWIPMDIDHACLEVTDTGSGIAEKDMEKVFDPFYSTRFYGRGMGLSVVLGIVSVHSGGLVVESEPGRGSVFRIFLPVSTETIPLHPVKRIHGPAFEVSGTVLLIEDEEPVRNLAAIMLARLGFTVLEATNGIEALELFQQHQSKIRCVFSDLTMPDLDGWQVLSAVRKLSPDIPVILSSGYDEAKVMSDEHSELPDAFLGKPYRFQELRDAVYQALLNR